MCHVLFPNMLRSRLWQACQRSAAIPACSAPEAATQWQTPCSAAHLTQTRNFEIGVVRDKLSNAIREYREIVQKDRLKYYWDRKQYHIKPAAQRVLQQKETKMRQQKQQFRRVMHWVEQAKERGF